MNLIKKQGPVLSAGGACSQDVDVNGLSKCQLTYRRVLRTMILLLAVQLTTATQVSRLIRVYETAFPRQGGLNTRPVARLLQE